MKKLGAVILLVVFVAGVYIVRSMIMDAALESMGSPDVEMRVTEDGMSITLIGKGIFRRQDVGSVDGLVATYASDTAVVVIGKESFLSLLEKGHDPAALTEEDYAQLLIESNDRTGSEVMEDNGIPYYTYEYEETDGSGEIEIWTLQMCVLKGTEDFWRIGFACPSEDFSDQQPDFFESMRTIQLS